MFSTETTVSGAAANGAIPKVEQNWNVIRTKKGTVFIIQKVPGCQTEEFLHKINVLLLQHSRKKSLPDSSFLHRSDSSQPPYQPLDPPSGELSKNFSKSHPNDCSCSLTKTIALEKTDDKYYVCQTPRSEMPSASTSFRNTSVTATDEG